MNDRSTTPDLLGLSAQAEALAGSAMARAIARFDWPATPLGEAAQWPASLKSAARLMLGSRYPMFLWWGESLTALYNDAYIDVLGPRHPWALGRSAREIWAEIWDVLGPQAEGVLLHGRSTWNDRVLLVMQRKGYTEETYFTFSYSPAFDDAGAVGGVFCTCTEDTARVLGERRLQSLRALSDAVLDARSAEQACVRAAAALGGNAHDLPFVLVYLLGENAALRRAATSGVAGKAAFAPARAALHEPASAWPFAVVAEQRLPRLVNDLGARFGAIHTGPWPEPIEAALVLPLTAAHAQQSLAGFVVAGLNPRHPLDEDYRDYLALAAQRIGAAIADARAFEAEQQRAQALAELDRAKTAFFSNVSHELRTPLALMLGPLADLLGDAAPRAPEDTRELLRLAQRNGRRLQRLVNALLDFSRLEAGRMQPRFEPTDLAAATRELASVFRAAVERAGLRLAIDCAPLPQRVLVDRAAWEKIVFNLLGNALKHTFEGGIEVALRTDGDAARLEVRDSGIGIPEALVPRVFERFFRVEGARARSIEGSGIGLALVAELAQLHGGSVAAESCEGSGSTFSVRLPFGSAHLPAEQVQAGPEGASTGLAEAFLDEAEDWLRDSSFAALCEVPPMEVPRGEATSVLPAARQTVLVADDNADMRAYLARLLGREHRVLVAADGIEALARAREELPDLVLADVMMPRLDGFALLRRLRAETATAAIPIVLLSARAGEEARLEGLETGADDYLTKPFHSRELLARVTGTLSLARLRREAAERERSLRGDVERILASIAEGFLTIGPDWRIGYVNSAAEQVIGLSREALFGRVLWEQFPALIGSRFETSYRHVMTERVAQSVVAPYAPLGGWIEVHVYPVERDGIALYFHDVTQQRRLEETLRDSEAQQRFLVELGQALLDIAEPDALVHSASRRLGEHLRVDRCIYALIDEDENSADVSSGFRRANMPLHEGRFRLEDFGREQVALYRQGLPFVIEDAETDARIAPYRAAYRASRTVANISVGVLRLGRLVAGFAVHQASARAWHAAEVALVQAVAERLWEAMERVRVAREQRASEQRFRELADAMPQIVYVSDSSGRIEYINRQWIEYTGQQRAEQADLPAVVHPEDMPLLFERWTRAQAARETLVVEFRLRGVADGQYRWFLTRAVPVPGAGGEIARWYGTSTDIDAQKRTAEGLHRAHDALQQADRHKDRFLAVLAHELRNPLAPLRNAVQLLQMRARDAEAEPVHAMMRRQIDHLVRLVDDLLEVSRIKSGKVALQRAPLRLVDVLANAVETSGPLVEQARHRLDVNTGDAAALMVDGDAVRLAQVFANLINNAARYTPEGGRIELCAWPQGAEALVAVRDNGEGLAPDTLAEVFEPFVQVSGAASSAHGLGLGLALVRSLVALHGGSVEAKSAGLGRGSEFIVRLPLAAGRQASAAPDAVRAAGRQASAIPDAARARSVFAPPHAPVVLVVDDNRDAADSLASVLEALGACVRVAYDGPAALAAAKSARPRIVLLDLGMPGMDGLEVGRRLRAQPHGAELLLVALTGWGHPEDQRRVQEAGFDRHLVKPAEPEALRSLMAWAAAG